VAIRASARPSSTSGGCRAWSRPLAFGAALGVSGALFQTLTRNNLGSPDILGFSTGAYTGVLLLTIGLGTGGVALAGSTSAESGAAGTSDDAPFLLTAVSSLGTAGAALIGGVLTAVVVYVLAFKDGIHGFRLIIVGIAVSALLQAVNTYLLLTASEEVAMGASIWGAGTLSLVSWSSLLPVLVVLAVLVPVIGLSVRALHQLELGDDMAAAHGVGVERVRRRILLAGVVLVARDDCAQRSDRVHRALRPADRTQDRAGPGDPVARLGPDRLGAARRCRPLRPAGAAHDRPGGTDHGDHRRGVPGRAARDGNSPCPASTSRLSAVGRSRCTQRAQVAVNILARRTQRSPY
jgi:ABC-type cobalamin transport system permease subunit